MTIREQLAQGATGKIDVFAEDRQQGVPTSTLRLRRGKPQASRKEGHDALIDSLRGKKTYIHIRLMSGDDLSGRLLQSDRFTISILEEEAPVPTILFKHAIESFNLEVLE